MGNIEVWKKVEEDLAYEVSDLGRVRRITTGRILIPTANPKSGYLYVWIGVPQKGKRQGRNRPVHRLVNIAFNGPPPDGRNDTNHIDGDRKNNNASNHEWVSRKENMDHARKVLDSVRHGSNHPYYGKPIAEETKDKIRASLKETWKIQGYPRTGMKNSEEWHRKRAEYYKTHPHPNKGKVMSEEAKRKMSESKRMKHYHLSEEHKRKIAATKKIRKAEREEKLSGSQ